MKLIERTGVCDPAASAALEEYCVRRLEVADDLLLLYVNAPAVVIGRHQVAPAEADLSYLARRKIALLRRLSGGGAVFHDPGNLNFAFVTGYDRSRILRYDRFLAPVIETLRALGAPARFKAPNAVAVDGRKVSGNAQFTDMRRMLTHGTLLFSTDLDSLRRALRPAAAVRRSRGVASAPSPVANLSRFIAGPSHMEAFCARFRRLLGERIGGLDPLELSEEQEREIEALSVRYRSWEWTWGRTPRFVVDYRLPGPARAGSVRLTVEAGIVTDAEVTEGKTPLPGKILSAPYDELAKVHHTAPTEPGRRPAENERR